MSIHLRHCTFFLLHEYATFSWKHFLIKFYFVEAMIGNKATLCPRIHRVVSFQKMARSPPPPCVSKSETRFISAFHSPRVAQKGCNYRKNIAIRRIACTNTTFQYVRAFLPAHPPPWYSLDNRTKQLKMHRVNELWHHDHTDRILISIAFYSSRVLFSLS